MGLQGVDRLLAGAALAAAGLWTLLALVTWRSLTNGSRVGTPWQALDGQTLLLSVTPQAQMVLGVLILIAATTAIGYGFVVRPLFGGRGLATAPWMALAGFMPGYLLLVPVARLVTLLTPNTLAPWLLWTLLLAAAAFALWRIRPPGGPRPPRPARWAGMGSLALALVAALTFSVLIDRAHVMGSASHDFTRDIYLAGQFALGQGGRFPLISQHYDEPAFLYPLVYGFLQPGPTADGSMTVVYWLLLAYARVALAALVYVCVRSFGVDRLSSFVLTLFVYGASLSLNPAASNILFESLSPLSYTLHPSRVLGPVAPLLFLAASASIGRGLSLGGLIAALLMGAGLASMTVSIGLVFGWMAIVLLMTAISPAAARGPALWRGLAAVAVLVIAAMSFAYALQGLAAAPRAFAMLGASVAGGGLLFAVLVMQWARGGDAGQFRFAGGVGGVIRSLGPSAPYWLACAGGYALAFAFFGNVLLYAFIKYLGPIWPWGDVGIWNRVHGSFTAQSAQIMQSPFCKLGESWGFRVLTEHCGSLPMFARTYGLPIVLVALLAAYWLWKRPKLDLPDRTLTLLFWGLAVCLLAMPVAFMMFDFLFSPEIKANWARHLSVWSRARLAESWFYGALLIAGVLFFRAAQPNHRRWAQTAMMAATALYIFNPLTAPAQMAANAAYLVQQIANPVTR